MQMHAYVRTVNSRTYLLADMQVCVCVGDMGPVRLQRHGGRGLRVVSAGDMPIGGLGRKLSQHPRTCFAVVAIGSSASSSQLEQLIRTPAGAVPGFPI
jgi:hypothetical protein